MPILFKNSESSITHHDCWQASYYLDGNDLICTIVYVRLY